jgi:peptide chain release factor 2
MLQEAPEQDSLVELRSELDKAEKLLKKLEFQRMFSLKEDPYNCYMDIQAGSGGTEAQDWAEMLMRMYLRWGEHHNMQPRIIEVSQGEVAGIKGATLHFPNAYAFGWLRTETGIHRLVRKSPFDSGNRRHTSFASVFVSPEIDDDIDIEFNMGECRVDTYRASGAGGQHVNTTDSAVRITHLPSNTIVQCQSERSQHKNKAHAIKQLRAKLYQIAMQEKMAVQQTLEEGKSAISWGNQIRSYVLDASRIKDLRTGVETSHTQSVLDGAIDLFIEASLKQGVGTEQHSKKT